MASRESALAAKQTVLVGDRSVVVVEMTVARVRELLIATPPAADPIHALAFPDFGLHDLACQCEDLSASDLEQYTPSQLAPLVAACKDLNPHFFRVRAALSGVARMMLAEAELLGSSEPA